MPPKKRQIKSAKSEAGKKKKKTVSSDSEFDSDFDNNGNTKPDIEDNNDTFTDENVDESMYPKESGISGRLLVCGGTNWDLIGRKELPKAAKTAPTMSTGIYLHNLHCLLNYVSFINRSKSMGSSPDKVQSQICYE